MAALGKRSQLTVCLPEDAERPEIFALLNPVHQELARAGGVRLAGPPVGWGGLFANARRTASRSGSIEAHSLGSAADEARAVAVRVRSLLRSGVAPDAIAITSLRDLSPEVGSALEAAGIPVSGSQRTLIATLAGQAPLMVLAAAEEGVPRERLCELLEARLLTVHDSLHWAQRLREAGSGPHARQRLFPPLEALLRREQPNSHKASREGFAALEGAVERIAAMPAKGTITDQARSLWRVLNELGVLDRLTRQRPEKGRQQARQLSLFGAAEPEERSFQAPWVEVAGSEGAMALEQVKETLDSLVGLDLGGPPITNAEFATLLRDALTATPARSVPALVGGVTVAPVEALLGRRISHVLITGLAGDGPPVSEDPFLPEGTRRQARELTERPAILPPAGPQGRAGRGANGPCPGGRARRRVALGLGLAHQAGQAARTLSTPGRDWKGGGRGNPDPPASTLASRRPRGPLARRGLRGLAG